MRLLFLAVMLSGCGSALWLLQPRPEVTYQEVTRTSAVQVTSNPPGAKLYVDGAEAGVTPRAVNVAHKVVMRQRRQAAWLPLIGTLIDTAAFTIATISAASSDAPEAAVVLAGAGIGVVTLDLYLITGRSIVHEGVDTLPAPLEVTVTAPGLAPETRKVRVPDITDVRFELRPGAPAASSRAPASAPAAPAAP